jgi:hypothetical protein
MSNLNSLFRIIKPADSPIEAPSEGDWYSVELKLGFVLPDDYKGFVSNYGTGAVDGFLWVLNPVSKNRYLNLFEQATIRLNAQRQFSKESGVATPYSLHPETGLFPWGFTDNGDVLYWLREGPPSSWSIVVCDSRSSRWQAFRMTVVEFISGLLMRTVVAESFPDDFPSESPEFNLA